MKGGGVLTLVDNPRLFVLSNLSRKFLSNKLDDISTSLLLAGLTLALPHSQTLEITEGAPGTHCSHMRELSMVTCILSVTLSMH